MASFISDIFPTHQTTALYTRTRYHLTRVQQQVAALLQRKGMSEQYALPMSKFLTLLLIINFPVVLTLLGLFTCIFTSFASGACAVLAAILSSILIALSITFFLLSLVMFGTWAFTLLSTMLLVSATCCAVSMYALVFSYKAPKLFTPTWKPFRQTTQSNSSSDPQIHIPTDPGAGITTPGKRSPTSSFDHDVNVDSTIASDCSGSAE